MDQGITLTSVRIKNFLSISDVSITPGKINQIVGGNSQGKTSVIKALETALKGSTDGSLVKIGESQAEIILEFSDGMSVRRKVGCDGSQSVKVSKNEMDAKQPQAFLNALFDSGNFDPISLLEPKRRQEALLKAIPAVLTEDQVKRVLGEVPIELPPVNYADHGLKVIDQLHDYFYARRSEANKKLKDEESRLKFESARFPDSEAPEQTQFSEDNFVKMEAAYAREEFEVRQKVLEVRRISGEITDAATAILSSNKEIIQLEAALKAATERRTTHEKKHSELVGTLAALGDPSERLNEISDKKAKIAAEKTKYSNFKNWELSREVIKQQEARTHAAAMFAEQLDECVRKTRGELKDEMMASCQMPITGIAYQDGVFTYEGFKMENLSTSASMRLACAIARTLSQKTKIICLDGCESLDEENYVELKKEIEGDGFTYFLTRVGEPFRASDGDNVLKMQKGMVLQ